MVKTKLTIARSGQHVLVVDNIPFEEFVERLSKGNPDNFTVMIAPDGEIQVDLANYSFTSAAWNAQMGCGNLERFLSPKADVPALAQYILLLIPKKHRDPLLGDLREEFETILLPTYGTQRARLWYWWHTILSVCPFAMRIIKRALGFILISKLIGK